jgi:GTP:adenosylcobinamide-phosphate guanylyltransferase
VKYTAIVLAGSRPGRDDFAGRFGVDLKALIPVAGEPMIRRPVRALLADEHVADVIVLTQHPAQIAGVLPDDPRISVRQSGATIATTMMDLCFDKATAWPLLVTTADHALLDAAMIDEFCAAAAGADIAVAVIEKQALEQRLPQTKRTWLRFRGGAYTGANLFALTTHKAAAAIELWRSVEQDRKKGWRIVSLLGPLVLVGTLLRLLSLEDVLGRLGGRIGLTVKPVVLSNPLAGVDVDKPEDHALVEAIVAGKA